MATEEARPKDLGLKLAQLASYDDIITDAMVDNVYFWTTIRKNRARYSGSRHIKQEDVCEIIRQTVIVDKDPALAVEQLLELAGLKREFLKLKDHQQDHFQRHLRKYVNIYNSDCPFEVTTTNRYTIDTQEAAVSARRDIRKGEQIRYLSGIQAPITKDEEKTLDLDRLDFSIVMSSRKRTPALFLGPARFANHDCNANARLTTVGSNGMTVVAARDIDFGDEITVSYGTDYFGKGNCECLCATCESKCRNGWAPADARVSELDEEEDEGTPLVRSRRRTTSESHSVSRASSTQSKKRKAAELDASSNSRDSSRNRDLAPSKRIKSEYSSSPLKRQVEYADPAPVDSAAPGQTSSHSEHTTSPGSSSKNGSPSSRSTLATTVADVTASGESRPSSSDKHNTRPDLPLIPVPEILDESALSNPNTALDSIDAALKIVKESGLLPLTTVDGETITNVSTTLGGTREEYPIVLQDDTPAATTEVEDDWSEIASRKPGDYTLTPLLLPHSSSRWVSCNICDSDFVQHNAWQTRQACPRCERHLKLYGYTWPKTDKEGKYDAEERIDHRTVVQFVDASQERIIKKGKNASIKNLLEEKLVRNDSSMSDSVDGSAERPARLRKRVSRPMTDDVFYMDEFSTPKRKRTEKSAPSSQDGASATKKRNRDEREPAATVAGEKSTKRHRLGSPNPSGRLAKVTTSAKHALHTSAGRRHGDIIARTGKPRVRAVRSDKGIPRPQRRLPKNTVTQSNGNRSRTQKPKSSGGQADGWYDIDSEDDISEVKMTANNKANASKPRWLGMSSNSSKSKVDKPKKPKPGWVFVDPDHRPKFEAPPSPPRNVRKASTPQTSRSAAPKRVKPSWSWVDPSLPPPKAAPPSPPPLRRRRKSKLEDEEGSDSDDNAQEMDGSDSESDAGPRRSNRAAKPRQPLDSVQAVEPKPKKAPAPRNPPAQARKPLAPPRKTKATAKKASSMEKEYIQMFIELAKQSGMHVEEAPATPEPSPSIQSYFQAFVDKAKDADLYLQELPEFLQYSEMLVKFQDAINMCREQRFPNSFYESGFLEFLDDVQDAMDVFVRIEHGSPDRFIQALYQNVRARFHNYHPDPFNPPVADAIPSKEFEKIHAEIRQKFDKEEITDPHFITAITSIEKMLRRRKRTDAGEADEEPTSPPKRRRVVEDEDSESDDPYPGPAARNPVFFDADGLPLPSTSGWYNQPRALAKGSPSSDAAPGAAAPSGTISPTSGALPALYRTPTVEAADTRRRPTNELEDRTNAAVAGASSYHIVSEDDGEADRAPSPVRRPRGRPRKFPRE